MKGKKLLKRTVLSCMAMSMALAGGCGSKAAEEKKTIAVIAKGTGSEYWDTVNKGAEEAGEELGISIECSAPTGGNVVKSQNELIEAAVDSGAAAIVLAPISYSGQDEALQKARDKGLPIITIDSDTGFADTQSSITTQNIGAGAIAGRYAGDILGGEGKFAIINHSEEFQTTQRMDGFVHALTGYNSDELQSVQDTDQYSSNVKLEEIVYCGGVQQRAEEEAKRIVSEHPDVKLIYTTNEPVTISVCKAIDEMGVADSVQVVGFDCPAEVIKYIDNGVLDGTMVQNPYNMGYLGVRYANKMLNGESITSLLDTGAVLINKDNFSDDNIQLLVYPLGK